MKKPMIHNKTREEKKCLRCGWVWLSYLTKPTLCPSCKSWVWFKTKTKKKG
jgi:predicted Zn-ribbon and HTH transcriptional regulator